MPFMSGQKNLCNEPVANWNSVEYFVPTVEASEEEQASFGWNRRSSIGGNFSASVRRGLMSSSIRDSIANTNMKLLVALFEHSERPSDVHTLHDVEFNEVRIWSYLVRVSLFHELFLTAFAIWIVVRWNPKLFFVAKVSVLHQSVLWKPRLAFEMVHNCSREDIIGTGSKGPR